MKVRDVGEIGNYYGGLAVRAENDKFYWELKIGMVRFGRKYLKAFLVN